VSEYTTRKILEMIEENDGPEDLDLAGADLLGIDLSREAVKKELDSLWIENPGAKPTWWFSSWCFSSSVWETGVALYGANLEGAILADADLEGANLTGAHLEEANLYKVHLEEAHLQHAHLEEAYLDYAHLERADLTGAYLQKVAMRHAHLEEACLDYAHLERANLTQAHLERANLLRTHLEMAYLDNAHLEGAYLIQAYLQKTTLEGSHLEGTVLAGAHLGDAILNKANLEGAVLAGAHLPRLDLRNAESIKGIHLYRAWLDDTRLTKKHLGKAIGEELVAISETHAQLWFRAKEAYLGLKTNFEQIGRYDDASWAYRKERRMEKREAWRLAKDALQERDRSAVIRKTWKTGWDLVVEYLCGYGESVGRVLFWMGFVILIAGPLIFGVPGLLRWPKENYDTFLSLSAPRRHAYAYVQHLLYVLDAFTTANFAELQPANALTRFLSALMALIGVFLTGLLGFVAGNRIRRS